MLTLIQEKTIFDSKKRDVAHMRPVKAWEVSTFCSWVLGMIVDLWILFPFSEVLFSLFPLSIKEPPLSKFPLLSKEASARALRTYRRFDGESGLRIFFADKPILLLYKLSFLVFWE